MHTPSPPVSSCETNSFDLHVLSHAHASCLVPAGLPDDVTLEEVVAVFSKCGVIKQGDDRSPRVKIYRDRASGVVKGDALVTYLKEPSVALATQILDGTPFRCAHDDFINQSITSTNHTTLHRFSCVKG